MSIHDGHRNRLKERFIKEGLDHFSEINVLELLLFYCIPRKDTNELAHALLKRFGSFSQVIEAPVDELKKVDGMGQAASVFISFLKEFCRYYSINRETNVTFLNSIEQCGEYLVPIYIGRRNETVFLLCLDAKCKLICCREIGEGSVNSAAVPIRKIVETALGVNASSVVLAHNHPSGFAVPSGDDVLTTKRLALALQAVDIQLADHIVVAEGDYVSMVRSGLYQPDVTYSII